MAPFTFTIRRAPVELTCEVGSIAEAIGILQAEDTTVRTLIATADDLNGSNGEAHAAPTADVPATTAGTEQPKTRKPRGSNKDKGDPATATAPAPEAIPGAATSDAAKAAELAKQVAEAAASDKVPAFLDRTGETAAPAAPAAAPPPPPAIPPAPPAPPAAPPSGVLAGKVIAELDKRMAGSATTGEALAGWLAQCGLVKAGTTYSDAIDAVRMLADDKVAVIAGQLGVAA